VVAVSLVCVGGGGGGGGRGYTGLIEDAKYRYIYGTHYE
jgi:hypothetical protein